MRKFFLFFSILVLILLIWTGVIHKIEGRKNLTQGKDVQVIAFYESNYI